MRLFFALPLPSGVKPLLAEYVERHRRLYPALKWVDPSFVHLTLRFLGAVSPEEPLKALEVAGSIQQGSCRFRIATCGIFPFRSKLPGVYWLGGDFPSWVGGAADHLATIVDGKGGREQAGRFTPHLTVARQGRFDGVAKLSIPGPWEGSFEEIVLYDSMLTPSGPAYKRVGSVSLPTS